MPKPSAVVIVRLKAVDCKKLSSPLLVQDVWQDWLFVGHELKGWVHSSQVVTMDEAPAYFTSLIEGGQDKALALNLRALTWADKGEFDLAIADLDEVVPTP